MNQQTWDTLLGTREAPACTSMTKIIVTDEIIKHEQKLVKLITQRENVVNNFGEKYADRLNAKIRYKCADIAELKSIEDRCHKLDNFMKHEIVEPFQLVFLGNGNRSLPDIYGLYKFENASVFWKPLPSDEYDILSPIDQREEFINDLGGKTKRPGSIITILIQPMVFNRRFKFDISIYFEFHTETKCIITPISMIQVHFSKDEFEIITAENPDVSRGYDEYELAMFYYMRDMINNTFNDLNQNLNGTCIWDIDDDEFNFHLDQIKMKYNL